MAARSINVTGYVTVFAMLTVLTLLTVGVSFVPLPSAGHLAAGLVIGAIKASLVVLFFMHAVQSPRVTWCVIVAAVVWVIILFSLTYSDYVSRLQTPYAPGH